MIVIEELISYEPNDTATFRRAAEFTSDGMSLLSDKASLLTSSFSMNFEAFSFRCRKNMTLPVRLLLFFGSSSAIQTMLSPRRLPRSD